jgi:TetR/AcrR family transcriptional regulator, transcriptional repressor for nem operon
VVDYRTQTLVGETHEPVLAAIEGIDGLRAWRDTIVSITEAAGCQGGCPLGSLGSELAELDHVARDDVAAGCSRWEAAIGACLQGMRDRGQLVPAADPASSPRPCWPRCKAGCCSPRSNAASGRSPPPST